MAKTEQSIRKNKDDQYGSHSTAVSIQNNGRVAKLLNCLVTRVIALVTSIIREAGSRLRTVIDLIKVLVDLKPSLVKPNGSPTI